jgi:hypothetical protein
MKPVKLYLLIPILLLLLSCNSQSADTSGAELTDSIPEGAVPFEYVYKLKKGILIPGTLNDSTMLMYWLETGFGRMAFTDSLAADFESKELKDGFRKVQKTMKVRMGGWERSYGDSVEAFYLDKNYPIFGFLGAQGIIPWQFFDKKIIEISFSKKYIRELSNTMDLAGYDSLKIEIQNGFLGIPVAVSVQGKKIKEFVMIDTGCNGDINFSYSIVSKYGIKSDSAFFGEAHGINGIHKEFSFHIDTIQVGNYFLTQKNRVAFSLDKQRPCPFSGLLGTGILQHFDIVLDLKNYCLYLKPVKK